MVKLTQYLKANLETIKQNWNDECIKEKYDFDVLKYIKAKQERIDKIVSQQYVTADISIKEAKERIMKFILS